MALLIAVAAIEPNRQSFQFGGRCHRYVRFGSLAAPQDSTIPTAAIGCEADIACQF